MSFALVDCNNFYASCEQLFFPSLEGKPVVVLSNNDGCVIARSNEAKAVGIKMGVPVFEIMDVIEQKNVHVFSTNYALYGDISQRVMNTLSQMVPEIEIYSIDEAFVDLSFVPGKELESFGIKIKETVKKWIGISVSVGIGPTKTLAKAANHLAKSDNKFGGVVSLSNSELKEGFLKTVNVRDIWGVGDKYAQYFNKSTLFTAVDLLKADEHRIKEKLGVVGQRIVLELRGKVCYPLNENPETKKEICTSRSFGHAIESYDELEQATTSYVVKVAQKLRKGKVLAQSLLIFIMTNKYASGPKYVNYKIVRLPVATNQTPELIHYARIALKALYRDGYKYKKSGIIVSEIIPDHGIQSALWDEKNRDKQQKLINAIDKINRQAGIEKVKFAIQGQGEGWKMHQDNLSPRYTTRWADILVVDVDKWIEPNL
jgi:DNA polymerase V